MNQRDDDRFRPRVGPPKERGSREPRFVSRVIRISNQDGPVAGRLLAGARRGQGAAKGRGHVAARFAGQSLGPHARRAIVKARLVVLKTAGRRSTETHLRYIQRDGVTRDGAPGRAYDATHEVADVESFEARGRGDRHQFRFIVAPEDAAAIGDLRGYTRELMARMEADLGTRLDWVAVDHWDTEHSHVHVVLRGKDATGADLVIARDYISDGLRRRAGEIATDWLGPRTEREIEAAQAREVTQERWTGLDRTLRGLEAEGVVDVRGVPWPELPTNVRQRLVGRLRHLETLGLAEPRGRGVWALRPDAEATLRALAERGDIVRAMQRAFAGEARELVIDAPAAYEPLGTARPIVGRVAGKGLRDELDEAGYLVVDALDGRAHYVRLRAGIDLADIPLGGVVELRSAGAVRAGDQAIAAAAEQDIYGVERDRRALRATGVSTDRAAAVLERRVRRLEALRRAGIVERIGDGVWRVPPDLPVRGAQHDQGRGGGADVIVRSQWPLDRQVRAVGATWLDSVLLRDESLSAAGFGATVREALRAREAFLVAEGLAERRGARVVLARNLLATLRGRDLSAAAGHIERETGLRYRPARDGQTVAGIYRRSVTLASGRFAMLDDGQGFTLVPWRPVVEPRLGQWVRGVLRAGNVSWRFDRGIELQS